MATLTKKWDDGGILTVTYGGSSSGSITIATGKNEGLDRTMTLHVKTLDGKTDRTVSVSQSGMREAYNTTNSGALNCSDGTQYIVLK